MKRSFAKLACMFALGLALTAPYAAAEEAQAAAANNRCINLCVNLQGRHLLCLRLLCGL